MVVFLRSFPKGIENESNRLSTLQIDFLFQKSFQLTSSEWKYSDIV